MNFFGGYSSMMLLTKLNVASYQLAFFFQEASGAEDFTIWGMIQKMGWTARMVAIVLAFMSMYSIAIMVERYLTYKGARDQSREFAPRVAQALKDNRIEEAINISDRHRKSHLAIVVNAGLQEFQAH
jgi:hypothetical protein